MPLALALIGQKCIIKSFACSSTIHMRMVDMGFIPGRSVEVMNRMNGALVVRVGESRLILNCCLASQIQVQ